MKILVISLAGIGDTILATPLIHELRLNFPSAIIDALVLWPGSKDLLELNPHLNHLRQKHLLRDSKITSTAFLLGLRKERYDISINTHPQSRMHYRVAAWLAGAKERMSHVYETFTAMDRQLANRTIPQDYSRHTVEQNLEFLHLLGKKPLAKKHNLELYLAPEDNEWAARFIAGRGLASRVLIGLHPGSGGTKNLRFKRWPLDRYTELLRRGVKLWPNAAFLLFGGPDEKAEIEQIMAAVRSDALIRVEGKLRQAAALIGRCQVFLSVDTALMHVAAAMRVQKQVVIEAPTLNKTNEPYNQPHILVPNPAVGGRNLDFYKYDGRGIQGSPAELLQLMQSVSVESVLGNVDKALRAL